VVLPHVAVGVIMGGIMAGRIRGGSDVFSFVKALMKQLPTALSVQFYRLAWRQFLFLRQNRVSWVVLVASFRLTVQCEALVAAHHQRRVSDHVLRYRRDPSPRRRPVARVPGPAGLLYDANRVDRTNPHRSGWRGRRAGSTGQTQPAVPLPGDRARADDQRAGRGVLLVHSSRHDRGRPAPCPSGLAEVALPG